MKNLLGFLVLAFCGITQGSPFQGVLPDVIIGDPYEDKNDILGPPLSEREMQKSLTLKMTNVALTKDPITESGFFEGDIMIQSEDELLQILEGDTEGQHSAIENPDMTWPDGVIPYVISASFSVDERYVIARAMSEYHQRTCIRFVPKTTQRDYIHILKGKGCSSAVGRRRGVQSLSLGTNCVYFGIALHEFMHAAGYWHEQSRRDRDNYVTIHWQNIKPGFTHNFDMKSSRYQDLPYDFSSIMHYGSHAFSINKLPTIEPKQSGVNIGQRNGFSDLDVQGLNKLYKCSAALPKDCRDELRSCPDRARKGFCTTDTYFMLHKCKQSCNFCNCHDELSSCSDRARKGFCKTDADFMLHKCAKSCNFCGNSVCQDQIPHCRIYALYCFLSPIVMLPHCKKTCGKC